MARNYDRLIRYYDSWFDDLTDPDKGFSAEEICRVLLTIRECQEKATTEPLQLLPKEIKRGLSMRTLEEQLSRIIERVENLRNRGRGTSISAEETQNNLVKKVLDTASPYFKWRKKLLTQYASIHAMTIEELINNHMTRNGCDEEMFTLYNPQGSATLEAYRRYMGFDVTLPNQPKEQLSTSPNDITK